MNRIGSHQEPVTSLKQRVLRAGRWTLAGHFLALALRLISSLILTRIFSPDTFGLLAIITAVSTVIGLLTDIGLGQAIIQSARGGTSAFLNTAWTLQILRGVVIWGFSCFFAIGLYFADRYEFFSPGSVYAQPSLPSLIVVSTLSAVILGFRSMKVIIASRDLNLRRVTLIEVFSQTFGLITVSLLGWATRSIWSYIGGLLLTTAFPAQIAI